MASLPLLLAAVSFAAAPFPEEGAVAGTKPVERLTFTKADLYGYINGGAELFLEFGFEELQVRKYATPDGEVALDLYRMATPEGALGIYLAKRGKETPVGGVRGRNTGNRYQVTVLKGRYFAQANNFKGREGGAVRAVDLLNALTAALPDEPAADLFAAFPKERRVEESEALFLGPTALQRLFTFGEGDLFLQRGELFGAAADYVEPPGEIFTLYRIEYPDGRGAALALENLKKNLDPTLVVTGERESGFAFRDFSGKSGSVRQDGTVLWLKTGLSADPAD